jgi:hypothetical protein
VLPEAPFLFSIAGLSASFAGLAGLVMALRRGGDVRPIDTFRLRQMVEFSFTNIIVAVGLVALGTLLGSSGATARCGAGLIVIYTVVAMVLLRVRTRRVDLHWGGLWAVLALGVSVASLAVAAIVLATDSIGAFELLLVLMLSRPMLPFLLVLQSWEVEAYARPPSA